MKIHEHDGYKVLEFEGLTKILVWSERTKIGKRYEGIMTLIIEEWCIIIRVRKNTQLRNING